MQGISESLRFDDLFGYIHKTFTFGCSDIENIATHDKILK